MKVRFGSFTFDSGRQQVLVSDAANASDAADATGGADAAGRVVPLSPKAYAVLELLLERRPDVIDKETLMAGVWFGAHVTDASLSMAIAEIRKALGDSAETPRYIRTAHRRGYAFCGEASIVEPGRTPAASVFWVVVHGVRTLLGPGETTVGRDPASSVWLDVPSVSWRHARIFVEGRTALVEDLGSTNGTFVGRRRVTGQSALRHGDALVFGDVRATFGTSAEPSARTERLP